MNKFNFLINLAVREWDPFVFVLVSLAAIAAKIFPETVIIACLILWILGIFQKIRVKTCELNAKNIEIFIRHLFIHKFILRKITLFKIQKYSIHLQRHEV